MQLVNVVQVLRMRPDEVTAYGKSPQTVKARALLCFWAHRKLGITTVRISGHLGICQSAVSRLSKRGEAIATQLGVELIEQKALKHRPHFAPPQYIDPVLLESHA